MAPKFECLFNSNFSQSMMVKIVLGHNGPEKITKSVICHGPMAKWSNVYPRTVLMMISTDKNCRENDSPIEIFIFQLWIYVKRLPQILFSLSLFNTSKMNFANNRLTNLRIFYTNFNSFSSFMVGILQTLTRVGLSHLLAKVSLNFCKITCWICSNMCDK